MAEEYISVDPDVFDTWLTPPEALSVLNELGLFGATETLIGRLRTGNVRSAAEEVVITRKSEREVMPFMPLTHNLWEGLLAVRFDSIFWKSGDIVGQLPGVYPDSSPKRITFTGIRFEPKAVYKIVHRSGSVPLKSNRDNSVEEPVSKQAQTKPPVKKSDLNRWHAVFVQVYPTGSEALALQSANAMFPEKSIPRQWVRDLRGPQPIGKPKAATKDGD